MHFSTILAQFSPDFFLNLLSIILIDLVLAGDNSIVIAMAVQSLPKEKRFKGIIFGALAAVGLRVIFTFFASQLLIIPYVKLIGGAAILWIALKLMTDNSGEHSTQKSADSVWKAVWIILIADITMSIDNILAVAGASHGSLFLLLFGLGLSIPLVVFASSLISKFMDRFPVIMWIGAAILGKVGAEMIITDPIVIKHILGPLNLTELHKGLLEANHTLVLVSEIIGVLGVVAVAVVIRKRSKSKSDNVKNKETGLVENEV
jgi:YjbE family integral membrane protein